MKFLKLALFILGIHFFASSNAQLTTQTKIVSRLNTWGTTNLDLKDSGSLLVLNFDRDSLSFYSLPDFSIKRGTYLVRLNNNFDTLWTKVIYNLHTTDCILNKSNKIILAGRKFSYDGTQLSCGLNLLKLDLNGNQLRSVFYNNDAVTCSFNNTSYYYETTLYNVYINEYKDNNYIVFNNSFYKFNDNFDLIDNKLYPNYFLANYGFSTGNHLIKVNDSTLATAVFAPQAFPGTPYYSNNAILVVDTQMVVKQFIKVSDQFTFLSSVNSINNTLYVSGYTNNAYSNALPALSFLSAIDLNNINIGTPKRILKYKPNYCVKIGVNSNFTQLKIDHNKLYHVLGQGTFSNTNDSTGFNNRLFLFCFDPNFNILWTKRVHLFNTFDSLPTDSYNSTLNLSANVKADFLFKANKLVFTNYNSQEPYYAGSYYNRANFGFNLSSIDTSGNNATCNETDFNAFTLEDSMLFQNLPIPTGTHSIYPQFIANSVNVENFQPQQLVQKCLPVQPPKSKFLIANTSPEHIFCVNSNIQISEYSYNEPKTWHWIFPPQADLSGLDSLYLPYINFVTFTQAGVFPISLVTTNAAGSDTATQYITVINFIPQPHLGNDTTICNGDSLRIIYTNPLGSAHYFTGPNNYTTSDTLIIKDSGQYIIAAYTICGFLYDTINVNVAYNPLANFGHLASCNALTVAFVDSSHLNGNPSLNYQYAWKPSLAPVTAFANYSNQPNNSFTFSAYDSFDVRLVVKSALTCVQPDSIVNRIMLKVKPVAACSALTNCGSLQVNFTSAASIAVGSIVQQEYYLGNTLIGTGASFAYTFSNYGNFQVKQVVKSNFNCISDTFLLPITIKDKPQVNLNALQDSVCNNSSYTITANATVSGSTISQYVWLKNNIPLAGNTNTITENNPAGTYTYKVVVTSALGCQSDTAIKIITVVGKPVATINAINNCGSKQITIAANATVVNDVIASHYINYGDGNIGYADPNNTTHTYSNFGSYTIKYLVHSSIGCISDTVYQNITVRDKPVVTISYGNNACQNTNFILTASATVNASSISQYSWTKNGLAQSFTGNILTDNSAAGTYLYTVKASSADGCVSDAATQMVLVEKYPSTIFTALGGCVGQYITLSNNSVNNNPSGTLQYLWTTSDGQTSTAVLPNFKFAAGGAKTIQLTTTTPNGCANTVAKIVTIDDYPVAAFDIAEACMGKSISISNSSTGVIANYTWQTSNGQQSSSAVPQFVFNTAGAYSIKLQVSTANNCSAEITKSTTIQPIQIFTDPAVDTNAVTGQPVQLRVTGADSYTWQPFTHLNNSNSSDPVFKADVSGIYRLTVEGKSAQGCKGYASLIVKVFAADNYLLTPNAFTPNADGKNDKFHFTCSGLQTLTMFAIYNRYGQTVYQQNNCNGNGWDGKFKGTDQPMGTYVYSWQGISFSGKPVTGNGTVVLIR